MTKCPVHDIEFRLVPAGVSKRTGKAYPAFYVCEIEGCKEKPVELSKKEPIDQAIAESPQAQDIPNAQTADQKRSYRIERQHSQSAAIEFIKLLNDLNPSGTFAMDEDDLWKKIMEYTNELQLDIEPKNEKPI